MWSLQHRFETWELNIFEAWSTDAWSKNEKHGIPEFETWITNSNLDHHWSKLKNLNILKIETDRILSMHGQPMWMHGKASRTPILVMNNLQNLKHLAWHGSLWGMKYQTVIRFLLKQTWKHGT